MDQRLSLVTLGVENVAAAAAFYERLGWRRHAASVEGEVAFFQLNGLGLGLFGRKALADDMGVEPSPAGLSARVSLAINLRDRAETDRVFQEAVAAGARALKAPAETSWGGYSGYFADPDGHAWEVAHNPGFPIDAEGNTSLG